MRRYLRSVFLVCVMGFWGEAQATHIVFDPTNFAQNLLTAIRTMYRVQQGVTQLTNQYRMIQSQVQNLEELSRGGGLSQQQLLQLVNLLNSMSSLSYSVQAIHREARHLYPSASDTSDSGFFASLQTWTNQARGALFEAMRGQSVAEQINRDRRALSTAVNNSYGAQGNLQVQQASNQMLSLLSRQIATLTQVTATTGRAQAAIDAKDVAVERAALERSKKSVQGLGTYTRVHGNAMPRLHY